MAEILQQTLSLQKQLQDSGTSSSELMGPLSSLAFELLTNDDERHSKPLQKVLSQLQESDDVARDEYHESLADILESVCQRYGTLSTDAQTAEPPASANADSVADTLDEFALDPEMMALFVSESAEHIEASEANLLKLEQEPSCDEAIDAVFRSFHTLKGSAGFVQVLPVVELAHAAEELLDKARDHELTVNSSIMDVLLESLDVLKAYVAAVNDSISTAEPIVTHPSASRLIESLESLAAGGQPEQTSDQQEPVRQQAAAASPNIQLSAATDAVKVERSRLDMLINLIGELVIAESMVHDEVVRTSSSTSKNSTQLRKITRELQELSLSLRMVPIDGLFNKMSRLVRDLSRQLDKPVDFQIEGGDTELDKTIVDQVADPLVHIVRNAMDHGIEPPDERRAAGKSEKASLTIRASHQGGNIFIELIDDGRGLDRQRILAKAVERGIVSEDAQLSDDEVHDLIFAPGFSTAQQVTELSGRGVGMDVVRRNIEALRGSVSIASEEGRGTCVSLRLPLTLAIIDGMLVRVGRKRFVIPTSGIVELINPSTNDVKTVVGRGEMLHVRGSYVPFFRVNQAFRFVQNAQQSNEASIASSIVVVVDDQQGMVGLLVDEVLGQQQVVIKSLGETLQGVRGIAGGAVLPDGQIGLILDLHGVLRLARGVQ